MYNRIDEYLWSGRRCHGSPNVPVKVKTIHLHLLSVVVMILQRNMHRKAYIETHACLQIVCDDCAADLGVGAGEVILYYFFCFYLSTLLEAY